MIGPEVSPWHCHLMQDVRCSRLRNKPLNKLPPLSESICGHSVQVSSRSPTLQFLFLLVIILQLFEIPYNAKSDGNI